MNTSTTNDASANKNAGYSLLQITLHWIVAALVIFQLFFGESMTAAVDAVAEGGTASSFDQQFA